jgi:hypothetical protein
MSDQKLMKVKVSLEVTLEFWNTNTPQGITQVLLAKMACPMVSNCKILNIGQEEEVENA